MRNTFLGVPTYDGRLHFGTMMGVLGATAEPGRLAIHSIASSLLTKCFNQLWCAALDARETHGITHFAMLHADIAPENMWLDKMHTIMETYRADVLSVVIPLKSKEGLTSTAIETENRMRPRRCTMKEVHAPGARKTWTNEILLLNTGLMLVDFRKPWVNEIVFTIEDAVVVVNGKREAHALSEDWKFSLDAKRLGARLFATAEIRADHIGHASYPNHIAWGTLATDAAPPETK